MEKMYARNRIEFYLGKCGMKRDGMICTKVGPGTGNNETHCVGLSHSGFSPWRFQDKLG